MNIKTAELFHELMKKGYIERKENSTVWQSVNDEEITDELYQLGSVLGFETIQSGDRFYMIPTQDNDLFLKNNVDYLKDVGTQARVRDLYLMNYISIYLIYLFFKGEGDNPLCRDFITVEEFISDFTNHCKIVDNDKLEGDEDRDFSENFRQLATVWLQKIDGEKTSKKLDDKYGVVNRILIKYKTDELFYVDEENIIKPTRKLKDLMPYFLRKDRIFEIQNWIKEKDKNATDK